MKPVAVFYATREGHTHRIAERVAVELRAVGLEPEVRDVAHVERGDDLRRYAGAVLTAPVHRTKHAPEMRRFIVAHRAELERMPTAFLSVSLTEAASEDASRPPAERAEAARQIGEVIDRFYAEIEWRPTHSFPVAGALLYSQYGLVTRFIMRLIAKRAGGAVDTTRDHVYTDWAALDRFVGGMAGELRAAAT